MQPSRWAGLALVALAAAQWTVAGAAPVVINPEQAADHVGELVTVTGIARDVRPGDPTQPGDPTRFALVQGQHGVSIRTTERVTEGQVVTVTGPILSIYGRLTLMAESVRIGADDLGAAGVRPWAEVADDPLSALGAVIDIDGVVTARRIDDGHGHAVQTGGGPWQAGAVHARAAIRFDVSCACIVLDAFQVTPAQP